MTREEIITISVEEFEKQTAEIKGVNAAHDHLQNVTTTLLEYERTIRPDDYDTKLAVMQKYRIAANHSYNEIQNDPWHKIFFGKGMVTI